MELIASLRGGESGALDEAIRQYGGYVMAVVQHVLGAALPQQDKEELVADTFVSLWKNAAALKEDSRLKAWLAVVAKNAAINRLRRWRPAEELQEDFIVSSGAEITGAPEAKEQARLVRQAVDGLQTEDRALFVRHYFWQQSIPAISQQTGMKESTIKSRLFRGRQALKTALTKKGDIISI